MKRALLTFLIGAFALPLAGTRVNAQSSPLSFFTNYFLTGDYEVGGVSLWRKGQGGWATESIEVSGVPEGVDIVAAFLYLQTAEKVQWTGIDHATFKGHDLGPGEASLAKALNWEQATRPCWSVAFPGGRRLVTYRADVLRFFETDPDSGKLAVNGAHAVSVPDYGYTYGDDDEFGIEGYGHNGARAVGASLVIVYRDPSKPFRSVAIYDGGATKRAFETLTQTVAGFYQAAGTPAARLTTIVGDGRPYLSERVRVNGSVVATNPYVSADGPKWDHPTFDGLPVAANDASLSLQIAPNGLFSDCVSLSAVVMSVNVQDDDGDGLLDVWERAGSSGPALLDPYGKTLPLLGAMGANPNHRDLFLQIDHMATGPTSYGGVAAPAHTHLPGPAALKLIGDAFAGAPDPIALHVDVGPGYAAGYDPADIAAVNHYLVPAAHARAGATIDEQVTVCPPGAEPWECQFSAYPGTVGWKSGYRFLRDQILSITPAIPPGADAEDYCGLPGYTCRRRFDPERQQMFHYALFAHKVGLPVSEDPLSPDFHVPRTNAGIADFPGGDVMVTLGGFPDADGLPLGTPFMQASTLMHELGHNLELRHGGGALEPNCKPTYFSVMNYLYQLRGLLDDGGAQHMGFSSNGLGVDPVNEQALLPLGTHPYRLGWFAPIDDSYLAGLAKIPTRFCNGAEIPVGFPASDLAVRVDALRTMDPVDWRADGDGDPSSPAQEPQDVNFDGDPDDTLESFDDWANIRLNQIGSRRNVGVIFPVSTPTPGVFLDAVGPLSVNLGKGDLGKGDLGKGDLGKGDLGKGDLGKGDLGKGDLGKGDLGKGDLGKGDLGKGDLGGGDLFDPVGFPSAPPGGELDFETFTSMGSDPAYEFAACVVGSGCANAPPELQVHDVLLSWTAAAGGVVSYTAYRAPGAGIPDQSLWTAVGPPVPATANPLQQIDGASLVNGATYSYFVLATYADGTTSAPSNFVPIIAVNDPLVAGDDVYGTDEDTPLVVAAPGVLGNDTDADDPPPTGVLPVGILPPGLTLNGDGSFSYVPAPNASGAVSFQYKATRGAVESNVATVTITIHPVNDAPVAEHDAYTMDQGGVLTVPVAGVLANDSDVDSGGLTAGALTQPAEGKGTVVLNPDGSFVYTPPASFAGTATFTYRASDGLLSSNVATVTITVNAVGYGFVNVKNLPPAPGVTFKPSKYGTLVQFLWQFTKNGTVVASSDAQPSVTITGPGGYNQTFTPANCGAFGFTFTYNAYYKKWEFNWKPKNAAVGTYYVVVRTGKTGQNFPASGGFPVVFKY
ncbi:MAG: Ig-like domain-containing protein [Vicinamibacterales bacterium]